MPRARDVGAGSGYVGATRSGAGAAGNDVAEGEPLNHDREDDDGIGRGDHRRAAGEVRQRQREGDGDAAAKTAPRQGRDSSR